jgi:15-cis-phytoene synthase
LNIQTPIKRDLTFAYDEAREVVRRLDRDRYCAALFAPASERKHLFALLAFNAEIARVRDIVSDPLPGEIRLQWWRDLLSGEVRGDAGAHPIALALLTTIEQKRLPTKPLVDLIEARAFDLYDDPMPTWLDLEGYCGETSSALVQLSAMILDRSAAPLAADAAGHGGLAFALTGLLRSLPWHSARGQVYIPNELLASKGLTRADLAGGMDGPALRDVLAACRARARLHLAATRSTIGSVCRPLAPAFLHLALVEPYLAQMEKPDYQPFRSVIALGEWRRLRLVWQQNRKARLAPMRVATATA